MHVQLFLHTTGAFVKLSRSSSVSDLFLLYRVTYCLEWLDLQHTTQHSSLISKGLRKTENQKEEKYKGQFDSLYNKLLILFFKYTEFDQKLITVSSQFSRDVNRSWWKVQLMESKWIYWCYNQDSILLHATQAIVSINTSLLDHLGVYSWHHFYFLSPCPIPHTHTLWKLLPWFCPLSLLL